MSPLQLIKTLISGFLLHSSLLALPAFSQLAELSERTVSQPNWSIQVSLSPRLVSVANQKTLVYELYLINFSSQAMRLEQLVVANAIDSSSLVLLKG